MESCLLCESKRERGGLCARHAKAIASCEDITSTQVKGPVLTPSPYDPIASLIDQWGSTHTISDGSAVGRSAGPGSLSVHHHSVSSTHAVFRHAGVAWQLLDRGSLNGTWVDGVRTRSANLEDGAVVGFGSVFFYFTTDATTVVMGKAGVGETVPANPQFRKAVVVRRGDTVVELNQEGDGGLAKAGGRSLWLTGLEYEFLTVLAERKKSRSSSSFISSQEILGKLDFRSGHADSDNLRQLVRRVRRKLQRDLGVEDFVESRQGVGYGIAWDVEA